MQRRRERAIVWTVAAVNLINVLDFAIVMPLGPDVAAALDVPVSEVGLLGSAYTFAAAAAGLLGSFFLDRFDRKRALLVAVLGLAAGTALAASATSLPWLLVGRAVAGLFGGPATSLSFSIVADVIPPARRGKAIGLVMGAFSLASILGIPAGLELARRGTWSTPLWVVAGLAVLAAAAAAALLPPMAGHLEAGKAPASLARLVSRPVVLLSWSTTAAVMGAGFLVIPNLSSWVQGNLGLPRELLSPVYLAGGVMSLVSTQATGRLVDRFGSFRTGTIGVALVIGCYVPFFFVASPLPVVALFMWFMLAMGMRNVSYNTLASRVPRGDERARFLSIQSAVQHLASAAGAFVSTRLLTELPGQRLDGMERVAWLSLGLTALVPLLLWAVERRVRVAEAG